jgi:RNA recognition motif-containing protein
MQTNAEKQISQSTFEAVEEGRKFVSQHMGLLNRLEEDVAVAMVAEGIGLPTSFSFQDYIATAEEDTFYNWNGIIEAMGGIQGQTLMGYGMVQSSAAFLNYVHGLFQHVKYLKKQAKRLEDRKEDDASNDEELKEVKNIIQIFTDLIVPTYERAISECPTVEAVWVKYLKHLRYVLHNDDSDSNLQPIHRAETLIQFQNVASRAVKNCPYSIELVSVKMQGVIEEVQTGRKVLEPDDLMKIVSEATNGGFLLNRNAHLDVYLAACRIVKLRILDVVSKGTSSSSYDDSERLDTVVGGVKKKRRRGEEIEMKKFIAPLEDDAEQEVRDLVEDLREMFDTGDAYLRKKFPEWTEGRYLLLREKAKVEAFICSPLLNDVNSDTVVKCYEKLVRVHQPPHPDLWRDYIQYMTGKSYVTHCSEEDVVERDDGAKIVEAPGMVAAKFRFIRNMYQRALSSIKQISQDECTPSDLTYENALKLMCEEFVAFETSFGSDESRTTASKLVAKKLASIRQKAVTNMDVIVQANDEIAINGLNGNDPKRKRDEFDNDVLVENNVDGRDSQPNAKKSKHINEQEIEEDVHVDVVMKEVVKESPKPSIDELKELSIDKNEQKKGPNIWPIKPKPEYMVKVGGMEYPAHPFTVHVSNLSNDTIDGELYDLFVSKCGAIVHARIFREKGHAVHGHIPKSKCAGMVQFEERESVEKALELSGEFGLHEKLVIVSRSHQPAVSIVPSGMHRVKPKGEGKNTKRNIRQKEKRMETETKVETDTDKLQQGSAKVNVAADKPAVVEKKESSNILAFKPRNVGQKQRKKKLKL